MSKAVIYTDGAGRERCSKCGCELMGGLYCDCNRFAHMAALKVPFHIAIPEAGQTIEVVESESRMELDVKVVAVENPAWWKNAKGLQGVSVDLIYDIERIVKNGRPKLTVIKRGEGS